MKCSHSLRTWFGLPVLTTVLCFLPFAASAQVAGLPGTPNGGQIISVTLDENCHGTYTLTDPNGQMTTGVLQCFQDPHNLNVPTFILPISVVPGDVRMFEPGAAPNELSELIRFPAVAGAVSDRVQFFSDTGDSDLSDVGFPTDIDPGAQNIFEDANGIGKYAAGTASYTFVSDGESIAETPEPGTLSLLVVSVSGFAAFLLRRRKVA